MKCEWCGRHFEHLERHHLIFGWGLRELSEKHGLVKMVCRECHHNIHHIGALSLKSKQEGQKMFEKEHSRDEFIKIFSKSWLDN